MNDKKKDRTTRDCYITYSPELVREAREYALSKSRNENNPKH